MIAVPTYYLSFRSALHIGERGVGQEETRTHVPADTLFGAICSMWRLLHTREDLEERLLARFTADVDSVPFLMTSAFPYALEVRFFPKPLAHSSSLKIAEGDEKAFRRVRYVSEGVFKLLASASATKFDKNCCVSGGTAWVTGDEKAQLSSLTDDTTGDINPWRKAVVPRVTLDRQSSSSNIWHFGKLIFLTGCGLWFSVRFGAGHEAVQPKFEAAIRLLGDEGLCGERGAGHGLFDLTDVTAKELPEAQDASHFVTLSPVSPDGAIEARQLTGTGAAYELSLRRGWITSPEAGSLRRKVAWMISEGSVLTKGDGIIGRLADVRPGDGDELCPHQVWRYGYSFPAGVRL